MPLKQPNSMEECVYFTRRNLQEAKPGKIQAWVLKENCPKCKKGLMGKPRDPKTGKAQIRAKEYVCPKCSHTVPKEEYEETLTASIFYNCPHCGKAGETQIPYKRKNFLGVKALVFECDSCNTKIPITKKMKEIKKK